MIGVSRKEILALLAVLCLGALVGCGVSPLGGLPDAATLTTTTESTTPESTDAGSASPIPGSDCLALGAAEDTTHRAVFDNLNNFRVANGLKPLIYSERLEIAADAHARDLYERSFFAHINPDGQTPGQRAVAVGFCHEYVGENIAAGQKSPEAAEIAWENSPSHRANMLEPDYKYAGIGFYQDPNGRMYWAQELAYDVP